MESPVMYQPSIYPIAQQTPAPMPSPAQSSPSISAVSINIPNPTVNNSSSPAGASAYGNASNSSQQFNPACPPMYNYMPVPNYTMPQADIYGKPSVYAPPPMVMPYPMPQAPQQSAPAPAPVPQEITEAPAPPPPSAVEQQQAPAPVPTEQPAPKAEGKVDVAGLNKSLTSTNMEEQTKAIEKIAEIGQSGTPQASELINEEIFKNLQAIIARDTSSLPGKTQIQMDLDKKQKSGAALTEQENAELQKLSPKEMADGNKIIGMWTMAVLQNNLRKSVNEELTAQGQPPVSLYQLPGMPEIEKNVKSDPNPEVRSAGIMAIRYLATPDDNQAVSDVLNTVIKTDKDQNVVANAQSALMSIPKPASGSQPVQGVAKNAQAQEAPAQAAPAQEVSVQAAPEQKAQPQQAA